MSDTNGFHAYIVQVVCPADDVVVGVYADRASAVRAMRDAARRPSRYLFKYNATLFGRTYVNHVRVLKGYGSAVDAVDQREVSRDVIIRSRPWQLSR